MLSFLRKKQKVIMWVIVAMMVGTFLLSLVPQYMMQ